MTLHQFLSILRARRGLAALILLAVMGLALAWVLLHPARYVSRAAVLLDMRPDPAVNMPAHETLSPAYLATQIDIVKSQRVAERVLELLPADQEPLQRLRAQAAASGAPQQWLVHAIQQDLDVKPARESNIINISWAGRSPAEAARVTNAFARAYADTNLNLKTGPARRYTEWFDEQVGQARARLQKAQASLSDFQQKAGIISASEQGDYETQRLAELSAQLIAARSQRRGGADESAPEVMQNPVVNGMRGEIARLEAKVQEAAAVLGPSHPRMQQMEAELRAMRSRVGAESERASRAAAVARQASDARIRDLQEQLAAQKVRVLATGRQRGDLSVLRQEVESAQKAYDTIAASAAQARLQGVATQGNVQFLGDGTEPLQPSGPTPLQAMVIALVGGVVLAVAGALLVEFANRRVRSVDDLQAVTGVPILGVIPAPRSGLAPLLLADDRMHLALTPPRSPA